MSNESVLNESGLYQSGTVNFCLQTGETLKCFRVALDWYSLFVNFRLLHTIDEIPCVKSCTDKPFWRNARHMLYRGDWEMGYTLRFAMGLQNVCGCVFVSVTFGQVFAVYQMTSNTHTYIRTHMDKSEFTHTYMVTIFHTCTEISPVCIRTWQIYIWKRYIQKYMGTYQGGGLLVCVLYVWLRLTRLVCVWLLMNIHL